MPLTDTAIRNSQPGPKPRKLADGRGLYLEISPAGGKWWRLKYRIAGKEKRISLGTYPDTTLRRAREKAEAARELISNGLDPSAERKVEKARLAEEGAEASRIEAGFPPTDSFEHVAREWFATRKDEWAPSYGDKIMRRMEVDIFPGLGREYIASITPPQLLAVLRRVEARGVVETAHRALENCSQVFRYAVAIGKAESNPARDLKDALRKPIVKHFPAITDPARLGELLRACDGYKGTHVVRAALRLMPMVLLRPGELRHARWQEFDLDAATWTVPAERMKRERAGKLYGKPHIVPLARQAVEVLRELHGLTGISPYAFRGERHHDRPMSDAAVNAALRAMGFDADEVTGHGFRATARTMLAERLGIAEPVIEAQLAHSVKDSLGRAYNRMEFQAERVAMMQAWADYLDQLRQRGPVSGTTGRAAAPDRSKQTQTLTLND
ncbi:MAG: integrase arm-type DNA-binding domain-containing protein [Variovorax sp.]|nr:integrase arm-type DNA-binding domain-containing protein [Variovorax sp.]